MLSINKNGVNIFNANIAKCLQAMITQTEYKHVRSTENSQKGYLKQAVQNLLTQGPSNASNSAINGLSSEVLTLLKRPELQEAFIDVLIKSKYVFQYPTQFAKYISEFDKSLTPFRLLLTPDEQSLLLDQLKHIENNPNYNILGLILPAIKANQFFKEELAVFKVGEDVGHTLAYAIARVSAPEPNVSNISMALIEEQGKQQAYTVKVLNVENEAHNANEGLKGAILIPNSLEEELLTVHVTWAGTHDKATFKADLERTAGEESYRRAEKAILEQILAAVHEVYEKSNHKKIKLVFSGHSLGGALAQLTLHSVQRACYYNLSQDNEEAKIQYQKTEEAYTNDLKNHTILHDLPVHLQALDTVNTIADFKPRCLESLTLSVWNAPGILKIIAKHSNILAKNLESYNLPCRAYYGMVHGDSVATAGQAHILDDSVNSDVTVLKVPTTQAMIGFFHKSFAYAGSFSTGMVLGAPLGPVAAVASGAALAGLVHKRVTNSTVEAHTMHHFKAEGSEGERSPFELYSSDIPEHQAIISTELKCKSTIVELGSRAISATRANLNYYFAASSKPVAPKAPSDSSSIPPVAPNKKG